MSLNLATDELSAGIAVIYSPTHGASSMGVTGTRYINLAVNKQKVSARVLIRSRITLQMRGMAEEIPD
jgi:hypothetical protein